MFTEVPRVVTLGQVNVEAVHVLEPGLIYDLEVYGYNSANASEFRYSVPAQILNHFADFDLIAPSAAASLLVRQSGTKTIEIEAAFTPPADWGTTNLYRNTVNSSASAVLIESGKKKIFHDQNIVYGTTYFYWVKVVDRTGNLSGFSPVGSITVTQLVTGDYSDDSISTNKMQNLSVTNAKITDLAVTNAKIASLAVTSAKIADLAVTNAKINDLNASKITAGSLRVDQVGAGASEIFVDAPAAIRLEQDASAPARVAFQSAAGTINTTIEATNTELSISPTSHDNGFVLLLGEPGQGWSSVGINSAHSIILQPAVSGGSGRVYISGNLGADGLQSTPPPGTTANRRLPLYDIGGTLIGYIWVSI